MDKLAYLFLIVWCLAAPIVPAFADATESNWQTYQSPSEPFSIKYPAGWHVSSDPKTGRIDINDSTSGCQLLVLPVSMDSALPPDKASSIFAAFLHTFAPSESWSNPEVLNPTTLRSVHSDETFKAAAVFVFGGSGQGTQGKFCIAKMPRNVAAESMNLFAEMMNSLKFTGTNLEGSKQLPGNRLNNSLGGGSKELPGSGSKELLGGSNQMMGVLPPTPFAGYQPFADPDEHSFTCEVPIGWKVEGGLTRASSIDARPWVKATSPDGLIVAFIGDGKIPPYSMPTATGTMLGFGVGAKYGGGEVRSYVPARKYVEQYVRNSLGHYLSNIQVVEAYDHPDVAAAVNGTVGATKSEAASIKFTGMYKDIPAVGYYLVSTKATVAYGTGVWWVSLIAGELSPADRADGGLSVILHMLQSFKMDPVWSGQSVANAGAVSRQYTQQSQAVSNSIMNRYWSQQAANDANHAAYWGRQAAQDHAADNFSDYIRGQQTVEDPGTGTQYKVNYGPQYHWMDGAGNYTGTNYGAPGPDWRQLMNVP